MKRDDTKLDQILDRVVDEIRGERVPTERMDRAAKGMWSRIRAEYEGRTQRASVATLRRCDDFQALIPAYLTDSLNESKKLLFEDHTRECVPCRRALKQSREARAGVAATTRTSRRIRSSEWSWALAAAALIAVALVGFQFNLFGFTIEAGGMVTVKEVEGQLLKVTDEGAEPVVLGDTIEVGPDEAIRTTRGSKAIIEMSDGSLVELNERTELGVLEQRSRFTDERKSSTLTLDRGNVIVEAAEQGEGRMFVRTDDATVAVKGTVFSVNRGIKGSRVSVLEGAVQVKHSRESNLLRPGQQIGTTPAVARVPLDQEIAWSMKFAQHMALLREVTELGREMDREFGTPGLRTSTRLLDRVPEDTVIYIAFPNLTSVLDDAYAMLEEKVAENPILAEWWSHGMVRSGGDAELGEALDKIKAYGAFFGDEIVAGVPLGASADDLAAPVILSELTRADEFKSFLEREVASMTDVPSFAVYEGEIPVPTLRFGEEDPGLHIWLHAGYFAASPELESIFDVAAGMTAPGASRSAFSTRLADLYRDGAEWIVGVDLETLIGREARDADEDRAMLERLGLLDLQHLIVERKHYEDRSDTSAVLTFGQDRRGITSWLAEPAPMGALGYVSPDAHVALAFVVKTPRTVVDDLFGILSSCDESFEQHLAEFESRHGVDIREDFAAPLGGEFALAFDGPVLPKPSWKLIVEVYDADRLQRSLEHLVNEVNGLIREEGGVGIELSQAPFGGRTVYTLHSLDTGLSAHYTFADGYLIAGPSRTLLERALRGKADRLSILQSKRFTDLLPNDGQMNFSAVWYQNLGGLLRPLARQLSKAPQAFGEESAEMVQTLSESSNANLVYLYGERDRIRVASTAQGGMFSTGLKMLLNARGMLDLGEHLESAAGASESAPAETGI